MDNQDVNIQKVMLPLGWPCKLSDAPCGMFVLPDSPNEVCFKTEYRRDNGNIEAYNSAGEAFCGDGDNEIVQPVMILEQETES